MGGRLIDWLGQDDAASRPLAASVAGLTNAQGCVLYFANDTKILSIYDHTGPAWFDVDIGAVSTLSFATMPDVDWSTPPTDGQFFVWDAASSKLIPSELANGTGIVVAYVGTNWEISSTITQYTDELAQDALGAAFAGGTHVGVNINYNDPAHVFDLAIDDAYVEALADGRIVLASIGDLADVDLVTTPPIAGDTLIYDGTDWVPGVGSTVGAIDDLTDVDTTTDAPAVGDMMAWDGTNWVPATPIAAIFQPEEPSAADFSVFHTGSAMTATVVTDVDKGVRIANLRSSTASNWKQAYALKPVAAVPFRAEARIHNPQWSNNDFFMIGLTIGTSNVADAARHLSLRWVLSGGLPFVSASHKNTGLNTVETTWTTLTSGFSSVFSYQTELWIAIEWTGTTINGYWSYDNGQNWQLICSEADSFFTGDPDLVGFGWEAVASDGGMQYNYCDHFHITTDLSEPMGKNRTSPLVMTQTVSGFNTETGTTYTPILSDADGIVECTNAAPITVTIPDAADVAFPLYTVIEFQQGGVGTITFVEDTSVTILSRGNAFTTAGQDAVCAIRKIGSDTWRLTGDLVP